MLVSDVCGKNNQRSQYALVLDSDVCGKNNQRSQYALVLDSDVCGKNNQRSQYALVLDSDGVVPMPVALCSWYLSMSMCRLVLKNSSVAFNLWCMDTISFFCLDSVPLSLRRLMLEERERRSHLQPSQQR